MKPRVTLVSSLSAMTFFSANWRDMLVWPVQGHRIIKLLICSDSGNDAWTIIVRLLSLQGWQIGRVYGMARTQKSNVMNTNENKEMTRSLERIRNVAVSL